MRNAFINGCLVISLLTATGCSAGSGGLFTGWLGDAGNETTKPKLIEIPQMEVGRAATSSDLGAVGQSAVARASGENVLGLELGASREEAEGILAKRGFVHENGEIWTRSEDRAMLAFGPNGLARIRLSIRYATQKMAAAALAEACPIPVNGKPGCLTSAGDNVYEARTEDPDGIGWLLVEELRENGTNVF